MKLTPNISTEIQNALHILNKALPETEEQIDAFISEVESGKIKIPDSPSYLTPSAIADALVQGLRPGAAVNITEFPKQLSPSGIEGLQMAARNGDAPLSEETIRKMKESQED